MNKAKRQYEILLHNRMDVEIVEADECDADDTKNFVSIPGFMSFYATDGAKAEPVALIPISNIAFIRVKRIN